MPTDARFRPLMDTAPVLIWCADADRRCIYVNKVWLDFTGRSMEQEFGCGWAAGVHPDDFARFSPAYADFFERQASFRLEYRLRGRDGAWRWMLAAAVPRRDPAGAFQGFIASCVDITEIKAADVQRQRALDEKAALLQELHHRVKNNAQVFASLLTIQANRSTEPTVEAALRTAASRASAIAVAQQQIHDSGSSAEFDLCCFVRRLIGGLGASGRRGVTVDLVAPNPVLVPLATAVPLGLIMRELLTNATSHGFPGGRVGAVVVSLERDRQRLVVTVADDGIGLPPGMTLEAQRSTGLTIVKSLSRQLGAELTMLAERGTTVRLALPSHP